MARAAFKADVMAIERAIDAHGLARVVEMLSEVCDEKADHIATNWGDGHLANMWRNASRAIVTTADARPVRGLAEYEGRRHDENGNAIVKRVDDK